VARALAVEPQVLLMDEPLSNLDALLRLQMRAELKGILQESRTTTIYVTQDQVEAMSLADRIAIMHGGEIVQYDTPLRIYQDPATVFCGGFIGNPPMNFIKVPRRNGRAQLGSLDLATPETRGETITLGVRPEELEPASDGQGFAANVMVAEPLGPHVLLTLTYDGQQVRYTAPAGITAKPGDVLTLRPTPAGLRWLDSETGRALN
jgi:multiple sugar transport system ATP-binding protein